MTAKFHLGAVIYEMIHILQLMTVYLTMLEAMLYHVNPVVTGTGKLDEYHGCLWLSASGFAISSAAMTLTFCSVDMPGFYPRPVLAFGYCRCLRLSVRPSARHQVCPRDNSSPVQARITKFGP